MSKELKVIADFYDFIHFNNFKLFMVNNFNHEGHEELGAAKPQPKCDRIVS